MSRIDIDDLYRRAIDVVEPERIRYLVYGGIALPAWGDLHATEDVDLVIRVDEDDAARLIAALRKAGFHVPDRSETLLFIDAWFKASMRGRDVDFALGVTEFDERALARAVRVRIYDRVVPIATAEDLILYKLVAHRRKDLAHIEDIIIRQGAKLDLAYLREWSDRIAAATGKFEVPSVLKQMLAEEGLSLP
ncbi:MAG: hypothetical protein HYY17_03530 [Planctomycetes bacterium]|nr:hypothetical protein [Planctomycetota bacterium]